MSVADFHAKPKCRGRSGKSPAVIDAPLHPIEKDGALVGRDRRARPLVRPHGRCACVEIERNKNCSPHRRSPSHFTLGVVRAGRGRPALPRRWNGRSGICRISGCRTRRWIWWIRRVRRLGLRRFLRGRKGTGCPLDGLGRQVPATTWLWGEMRLRRRWRRGVGFRWELLRRTRACA
jgi:hypothetical protein